MPRVHNISRDSIMNSWLYLYALFQGITYKHDFLRTYMHACTYCI